MNSNDYVRRFVFDNLDARGCIVSLDQTSKAIQQTHYYPPALANILNQFALAAVLLHDSIKVDCSVTIQLRKTSESDQVPISLMMADCLFDRRVRSIAEYDSELISPAAPIRLSEFANQAVLAITITPENGGERYQSIVPMEHDSLSACLEDYFSRSEQLPTWFKFFSEQERAVGIALHALPTKKSEDKQAADQGFERLRVLLNTLTEQEAFGLDAQNVLTRLFHDESCRLFAGQEVKYGCICSAQKSLQAIKSLGQQEVLELMAEQKAEGHQRIYVDCHFCFQRYEFEFSELQNLN